MSDDLVFNETVNKVCIKVSTEEDDILEADEEFILTLDTSDSGVVVDPDQATVTITDDDGVLLCTWLVLTQIYLFCKQVSQYFLHSTKIV